MEQPQIQVSANSIINKLAGQIAQLTVQVVQLQATNEALMQQLAEANKKTKEPKE